MGINHKQLVESYKLDKDKTIVGLKNAIESREIKPTEFDFGKLFIDCFGWNEFVACKEGRSSPQEVFKKVEEGDAGVNTSAFQNISGQIVYSATLEKYGSAEFTIAKMIPEVKALILDGEKMAGITEMGDVSAFRKEGDPYQEAGVGEDWIYTPPVPDYGRIVSVTWEAVFNDRTGQLLERCGDVGHWIGYGEEVAAIDCIIDENVTAHRYNWRTAGQIATYNDNTGSHTWDNLAATNTLVDWTNLNTAEQLFNQMTNPFTGTPIMIEPKHLIVSKQNEQTARRIINATEIKATTPGYATSANPMQATQANPYLNKYEVVTSQLFYARMATKTSWYLADIGKLAKRMVAEPLNVVQAPSNSTADFERRIVSRYRANKRYAHVTVQPRASVKSTVA